MSALIDTRTDFPYLQHHHTLYFDTAATALKPQPVIDAISHFYAHENATVHRGVYTLARLATDRYHAARVAVQHFLHAEHPEEIIFTRGTTTSLNLLAYTFCQTRAHPTILISEIEHHSNIVPWQLQKNARLKIIPVDDRGVLDLNALTQALKEGADLLSIAHISNVLGTLHPVQEIIELAHAHNTLVALDGAQAAPHLPIDVQELDVDFYAFSGHKLYGPTGIGILYGKQALLESLPPFEGGGDMIEKVTLTHTTYNDLPYRFEAGTPPIAQAIGLHAAIDYLTSLNLAQIAEYEISLLHYATEKLQAIPNLKIIGTAPEKGAIISFTIDGIHPLDLATLLDTKKIALRTGHHCSQPTMERFNITSTLRLSFGLYNTLEEIDQFIEALISTVQFLKDIA